MAAAAPNPETSQIDDAPLPDLAVGALSALCAAKLLLHLFTSVQHYGYFRDELYYLDMARHLDWGYVDAAPLVAVYARIALLMGGSLAALRILPAIAGTGLVALSILTVRELGGARYAHFLAGLVVLLAPGVLVITRILRTGNSRHWLWFGVLAGLGLENKHSTLFFGFAVAVAVLLVRPREFLKRWIWIAVAIAVALFMPNLIWQIKRHFPSLEDLENVRREGKNVVLPPLAFIKQQILAMHPVLFPVWLLGAFWLLRERRWRLLGVVFVVFFVTMGILHAKDYYLFPIYPLVFAAGAVAVERWSAKRFWLKAAVAAVVVLGTLPAVPLVTWMLSPDQYVSYQAALGVKPSKTEVSMESLWPQAAADQFGWPQLVDQVQPQLELRSRGCCLGVRPTFRSGVHLRRIPRESSANLPLADYGRVASHSSLLDRHSLSNGPHALLISLSFTIPIEKNAVQRANRTPATRIRH